MRNVLKEKSFDFALRITRVYKYLTVEKREYILSKQLLRSATSIGAMVREANNAESDADFIHKLAIAQKESDETLYWLELLHKAGYLDQKAYDSLYNEGVDIIKIIKRSIITVKAKRL